LAGSVKLSGRIALSFREIELSLSAAAVGA